MYFELKDPSVIQNAINAVHGSLGMVLTIEQPKRSKPQNAYYWTVLGIIAKNQKEQTSEDLHDELKWRVLGPDYVELAGKMVARIKPSRNLSKPDFSKLIEGALMMAAFLEIPIPAPGHFGLDAGSSVAKSPSDRKLARAEADRPEQPSGAEQ